MTMILYTAIMLCVLIFVHELGHFMACKALGVRVNEFALGMGPAFFKKQGKETLYSLRVLPIGGFCAMEGENEDSEDKGAFNQKPAWAKAIILAAGSFMNVFLAIVILSGIVFYTGTSVSTTIREVTIGSPAQEAGLLPGDTIVAIGHTQIMEWGDVSAAISQNPDDQFSISVQRDGKQLTFETTTMIGENGQRMIGIRPDIHRNPFTAIVKGTQGSVSMVQNMVGVLGQLFSGQVSASELTGPVGIAYIVDDTAKAGMQYVLYLAALISLNLAIVNMLPFPALDGGRLLFLVIQKMTGHSISDKTEAKIHFIGMMLLFALMIYVTWNDIERFIFKTIG